MAVRDPEVHALLLETLRLVIRAEAVLEDLTRHQKRVASFLTHAEDVTQDLLAEAGEPREEP